MRTYTGYRRHAPDGAGNGVVVAVHEDGAAPRPLDPRLDLRRHSPDGFEWGYAGSGPAQLALALAADALGDDARARHVYQTLKFKVVGRLPADGWSLTQDQVRAAVATLEREAGRDRS